MVAISGAKYWSFSMQYGGHFESNMLVIISAIGLEEIKMTRTILLLY